MSDRSTHRAVRDWLHAELDVVPDPELAIEDALRIIPTVAQRDPSAHWWSRPSRRQRDSRSVEFGMLAPEHIIWARPGPRGGAAPAHAVSSARPTDVPALLVVAAVAAAVFLVTVFALIGPSSLSATLGLAPGLSAPREGQLALPGPVEGGRDIIVAADGTGHFWDLTSAVAAAVDGDRLVLMPGTYRDSVIVTKDISIRGSGGRDAVILMPADADAAVEPPRPPTYFFTDDYVPGWRHVIYLWGSDASVSGLTIRGAETGTTVVIDGGAPTLHDLVIDPDGDQRNKTGADVHEGLAIGNGSTANVSGSSITAFVGIGEASSPTLADNVITGSCIVISGAGTNPTIRGNRVEGSQCPRMSIWVSDGAAPIVEANSIHSDEQTDGIRVSGAGSAPVISGNTVTGGEFGIWVGSEAEANIRRNLVTVARTGIEISGSDAIVDSNVIRANGIGIVLDLGAAPTLVGNTVCDNDLNLDLRDGTTVSMPDNDICPDVT